MTLSHPRTGDRASPFDDAVAKFRRVLTITALFSLCLNVLLFVGPIHMLQVYDRVLASRNVTTLVLLTAICAFLLLAYLVLDTCRSRVLVRAGLAFDEALREKLFRATLSRTLATRSGASAQTLRDMNTVRETFTGPAFIALCDAPFAILFTIVCFLMHWMLGAVALAGGVILLMLALANDWMTRQRLVEAGRANNDAHHFATSSVRNIEAIHALGMVEAIARRWMERHEAYLGWQATASDRAGVILSSTRAVRQFLQIAILGVGAWLAINREISPGVMIAASIMMGRALAPIEQAVGQWKALVQGRAAADRIRALFADEPIPQPRTALPQPTGELAVTGLVAGAPRREQPILRSIDFRLDAGQLLAVIGPSGSGKSTLARALVGVWPLTAGTVRIDGAELGHWDGAMLARHLGYLPQDIELFAGTIAENIARLDVEARDEDVVAAAKLVGVHEFILSLPDGYDTEIGEGGVTLSGGQRQRIALARAFYRGPRVVVLDEPNAHLDATGETELQRALERTKAAGITVVVITHKPALLAIADRVLLLDEGAVKLFGSPQEIVARFPPQRGLVPIAPGKPRAGPEPPTPPPAPTVRSVA